ncbi:hypothetical protein ACFOZ7_17660 [Natribaculum luteum]|uniref:Uncharacterized protein n=1 Tax=Natribaculum luteum TaxID=1586232 RepID=A0ABD5P476_9EURY|nr:hypothetical protein [Natribaculum luteum]
MRGRYANLVLVVVLVVGLVGGGAGAVAAAGAENGDAATTVTAEDPGAPFEVETERDPDPASNLVTVRVTIEPDDASLVDLRIAMERQPESLLVPNSYTTTISPSNNAVEVDHAGGNEFTVDELQPGERVVIEFQTVTTVSETESVDVADIDVGYTRNGQRLSTEFVATGDTTVPKQNARDDVSLSWLAGTGAIALVVGLVGGVTIGRGGGGSSDRREEWVETLENVEQLVENPIASSRLQNLKQQMAVEESDATSHSVSGYQDQADEDDSRQSVLGRVSSLFSRDESSSEAEDDEFDLEL